MPLKYFAYGSNMSFARLRSRINPVTLLGVYYLPLHRLCFHKVGRDGSGKCDAFFTGDSRDQLPGVVYEIDPAGKDILNGIEGLGSGYTEKPIGVRDQYGNRLNAFTYTALKTDPRLIPYSWYKHHVLVGAREAGLPVDHLAFIDAIPTLNDPDQARQHRESSIYQIKIDLE